MLSTWSDNNESNPSEKEKIEVVNICLMAINEDKNEVHCHLDYSCSELQDAFRKLHDKLIKLGAKEYKTKKKKI